MDTGKLRGSCLCGSVTYEVALPFKHFVNCHCSRCRKASGTAHAANALVEPDAFAWTSGEETVRRYDLPTARSFATCFCGRCGAPVPHRTRSGRHVVIPAGSLDDEPGAGPTLHAYWSSRAKWYRHGEDLPTGEEAL